MFNFRKLDLEPHSYEEVMEILGEVFPKQYGDTENQGDSLEVFHDICWMILEDEQSMIQDSHRDLQARAKMRKADKFDLTF